MNVEIGTEAAQFPFWEFFSLLFSVQCEGGGCTIPFWASKQIFTDDVNACSSTLDIFFMTIFHCDGPVAKYGCRRPVYTHLCTGRPPSLYANAN
jgi:hypothetical protein